MPNRKSRPLRVPYNKDLTKLARELRKNATLEERILWKHLRLLPVRVLRQRPIGNYIVDFYIPAKKIAIELDGGHHFRKSNLIQDKQRTSDLEELGINVIRYTNKEVRDNPDGIYTQLLEMLGYNG